MTGLRFVFTNSAGTSLPNDPSGGSVQIATALRDTLRSTGATYKPDQPRRRGQLPRWRARHK